MNLDSVQPSEIRVLVGGELCNIEGQPSAELVKSKMYMALDFACTSLTDL